jgi:D-alanyl-D-alanine carboxypeptidase
MWNANRPSCWVVVSLLLLLRAPFSRADTIDSYIRAEMTNQRLPGLALAVIRDGKPLKVRTYGLANLELNVPVTPDTVFRLASISKQIIATGVMLLVRDGKLTLDDPICSYLRDCPDSWHTITVRHTLTHTSGLPLEAPGNNPFELESGTDVIRRAYGVPLLFSPGERWSYSNLGYWILAEIISQTSGTSWPEFIKERVFKPLGMNSTRTTDLIDVVPNRAAGYEFRDNRQHNVPPLIALRPSGAFLSSLTDMIKWDAAVTAGTVITKAMQDLMWTPALLPDGSSTRYGFGCWIDAVAGHRRIRHGGSNPGFRTEYSRFVDERLDVIVLVNGESTRPDDIALEVANYFIPGISPDRKTIKLAPAVLGTYAGRYQVTPSNILTIAVDGPGLSIQSSEGFGQVRLLPETSSTFFISKDESYVFTRDAGNVTQLEVRLGTAAVVGATELKALRLP